MDEVLMTEALEEYLKVRGVYDKAVAYCQKQKPMPGHVYVNLGAMFTFKVTDEGEEYWNEIAFEQPA